MVGTSIHLHGPGQWLTVGQLDVIANSEIEVQEHPGHRVTECPTILNAIDSPAVVWSY